MTVFTTLSMLRFATYGLVMARTVVGVTMGPIGDLRIVNKDIAPDGLTRPTVLAGGTFPGILITANKNDDFALNVIDELTDGKMNKTTSIHWHGLFQRGTNWADGGDGVNQCPIASGHSFRYLFKARDQAGTFWYHSHLGTQYCDGLRGPIVVYDPQDPMKDLYDVDDENTVITVADWYHNVSTEQQIPAMPDSTLINGKGRYPSGNLTAPLAVVSVEQGKRYRMRLVSLSCDPNFEFSIDGHNMTVIEADGNLHRPVLVNSWTIFAGQRYSFILEANAPIGNYWIRAKPNLNSMLNNFDNGINSAILRYLTAKTEEPTSSPSQIFIPLFETDLKPLVNPAAPGSPSLDASDVLPLTLGLAFDFTTGNFSIDGVSFRPPSVPVLLQVLSGAREPQDFLPKGAVKTLPANRVIQLSLPAMDSKRNGSLVAGQPHPFHLHGHAFSVIRSAGSPAVNFVDPPRRDVVNIGNQLDDNVTIRFVTDNPGPWFLHCHIDWHLNAGFAMVFAEDPKDTPSANSPIPSEWDDLCKIYDDLAPEDH